MEGTGACPLVGGLIPIPLLDGAFSLGDIRGSCVPWGGPLGSLITDGWGCDYYSAWVLSALMCEAKFSQYRHF